MKLLLPLLFLCTGLLCVHAASDPAFKPTAPIPGQVSIPLQNPSFEKDKIGPHGFTPPTGWTTDGPFLHPSLTAFIVTNHGYDVAPDGVTALLVMGGHTESQTVPASVYRPTPGDIVTLAVALGPMNSDDVGIIALTLDGRIVAKNSATTTGTSKYPHFADATVTYRVQDADKDKTLGVALTDKYTSRFPVPNSSHEFDYARLSVLPATAAASLPPQVAANIAANAFTPPAPQPRRGLRFFDIGHSYHYLNYSFPDVLLEMSRAGGFPDHQTIGISCIFGSKVIQHWQAAETDDVSKPALRSGTIDVLTMVGIFPPDEGYLDYARLALQYNPHIRIFIQEIWLPWDANQPHYWVPPYVTRPTTLDHNATTEARLLATHQPYFQQMDDLINSLNRELGRRVVYAVPVGQAVIALRGKIIDHQAPGLKSQEELFADTLGHPQPPIQALTGYCFYAAIYQKSPIGLPIPTVLKQSKIPADQLPALNLLLQQLAWNAVAHHPLSGVTP